MIACQKPTFTWYSRSLPGSGRCIWLGPTAATAEDVGEDVAESAARARSRAGRARAFGEVVEVEAAEIEGNFLGVGARSAARTAALARSAESACAETAAAAVGFGCSGIDVVGVEAKLVVNLALLGIAENVVGFGERLELFFRGLVAGIHVGMIFTRELAERLADVVGRGGFLHAEDAVVVFVFVGGGGHLLAIGRQLSAFSLESLFALRFSPFAYCTQPA